MWKGFLFLTNHGRKSAISLFRLFCLFNFLSCKTTTANFNEIIQSVVIVQRLDISNTWPYKKLAIFIDDEKHDSKISKGQSMLIPISYGVHSIYARIGSVQSETINFIADTFYEPIEFFAVVNGSILRKKNVFLSQKIITDETWWPRIAARSEIDWNPSFGIGATKSSQHSSVPLRPCARFLGITHRAVNNETTSRRSLH